MTRSSLTRHSLQIDAEEAIAFADLRRRVWRGRVLTVAFIAVALSTLWYLANRHAITVRKEQPVSVLMAVAPPPPPPPPPPPEVPRPVVREVVPLPTPVVEPAKAPEPSPANDAVTENAPAQEGSDDFQIGAGDGTGQRGSGLAGTGPSGDFARGAYATYLTQTIRKVVQDDVDLRNKPFRVSVSLWLTALGKVIRAELRTSTGSAIYDRQLSDLLVSLPALEQPPPGVLERLPVQMTIDLRRSP